VGPWTVSGERVPDEAICTQLQQVCRDLVGPLP